MLSNYDELTRQAVERRLVDRRTTTTRARSRTVVWSGTSWLDGDTDGDGIYDGMDDQDHDDYWNTEEHRCAAARSGDKNQAADRRPHRPVGQPVQPLPAEPGLADLPGFVPAGTSWAPFPKSDGTSTAALAASPSGRRPDAPHRHPAVVHDAA